MSDLDGHYGCTADHMEMTDGPNGTYAVHLRDVHGKCGAWIDFIGRDCYCGEPAGHPESEGHEYTRSGLPLVDMSTSALADGTDWRSRAARGEPY
jgi:hypothetical protein